MRFCRRLRGAGVGQDRDPHSDKTGRERAGRADHEPNRGGVIFPDKKEDKDDRRNRADRHHLPVEISLCALLDGAGNFLHARIAGRGFDH